MPDKKLTDVTDNNVGKMTDNEIIKALEWCVSKFKNAGFVYLGVDGTKIVRTQEVLGLINRLQAENERLEKENKLFQSQNDYWRTEVKTTRLELIRAPKKAIKEFDERLKEDCLSYPIEKGDLTMLVDIDGYNNLLKELVGEDNA